MGNRVKIHLSYRDPTRTNAELEPLIKRLAPRSAPTKREWEALIKSGLVDERLFSNSEFADPKTVSFVREGILKQALTEYAKKVKDPNSR